MSLAMPRFARRNLLDSSAGFATLAALVPDPWQAG